MLRVIKKTYNGGWAVHVLDSTGAIIVDSGFLGDELLIGYNTIKSATIKAALNRYATQLDSMLLVDYLDLLEKFDWEYYKDPSDFPNREAEYLSVILEEIAKTSEKHSKLYTAYFNCMLNYSDAVYNNLQELLKAYDLSKREVLK